MYEQMRIIMYVSVCIFSYAHPPRTGDMWEPISLDADTHALLINTFLNLS